MTRRFVPLTLAVLLVVSLVMMSVALVAPVEAQSTGCPKVQRSGCCSCNIQKYKVTDPCNGGITLGTFCGAPGDCCKFPCCF